MFARDGIHLSEEGMKIVVTNIKFAIRRSLELENMRRRRSVQTNYGKSNQKQFPLKCTHTNQDLCSQSPQMIWLICNPQVLNREAANYFSQLCMLKHNMILGDSLCFLTK
jgi:hypothetical protein